MNYLEKKSTLKILKFTPAFVGGQLGGAIHQQGFLKPPSSQRNLSS